LVEIAKKSFEHVPCAESSRLFWLDSSAIVVEFRRFQGGFVLFPESCSLRQVLIRFRCSMNFVQTAM